MLGTEERKGLTVKNRKDFPNSTEPIHNYQKVRSGNFEGGVIALSQQQRQETEEFKRFPGNLR